VTLVLAFDTATSAAGCCLWRDGAVLAERREDGPQHAAQSVLALVDAALHDAGESLHDVDVVVVGLGPGSYTGLRIGIAAARGLAFGLGARLSGVSTLDGLLAGAGAGAVAAVDARRGEVFAAGAGMEAVALAPGALAARLQAGTPVVGDGAVRYRSQLEAAGASIPADDDPVHRVRASVLADLAAAKGFPERTEPLYLRRPDAEPAAA
jgi:tRNA threonylcarbamoyladenosine biosynthesis protein TsaB